jgi:hypothetical protein
MCLVDEEHWEVSYLDLVWFILSECLQCQSANLGVTIDSSDTKKQELTSFADEANFTYTVDSNPDPTFDMSYTGDDTMQNFFSRPLKIFETQWDVGSTLNTTIDPWNLYFSNPRTVNRINNYNNLKARLHLKIMINGNGFYYGKTLISYQPMAVFDEFRSTPHNALDLIQMSQRPMVIVDPTTSTGGEMVLPFFNYDNAVSIPLAEWQILGRLDILSINPLAHANGGTQPINLSIYAWAEDIKLSVPTRRS